MNNNPQQIAITAAMRIMQWVTWHKQLSGNWKIQKTFTSQSAAHNWGRLFRRLSPVLRTIPKPRLLLQSWLTDNSAGKPDQFAHISQRITIKAVGAETTEITSRCLWLNADHHRLKHFFKCYCWRVSNRRCGIMVQKLLRYYRKECAKILARQLLSFGLGSREYVD